MRYYISDLHFFHEGLNDKMDNRGFADAGEMNDFMVRQWNRRVHRNDEVVILGDFSFGKGKETKEILDCLNGKLYLIEGNHDRYLKDKEFDCSRFEWIKPYAELHDNKRKVILCHYPVFCYNGQYRRDDKGNPRSYMLYGHVHGSYDEYLVNEFIRMTRNSAKIPMGGSEAAPIPCHMINCFCKFSDYTPLTLEEWIELDEKRRERLWGGEEMAIFHSKKKKEILSFNRDEQTPVLHASICTGEKVAGFKNKATGKFEEVMLIQSDYDLEKFLSMYGIDREELKKDY